MNHKYVEIDSKTRASIYLRYDGNGPSILFIHGWLHSGERWNSIMELLSKQYTVFAPDLPGFGKSPPLDSKYITIRSYEEIIDKFIIKILHGRELFAIVADSLGALLIINLLNKGHILSKRILISGCPIDGLPSILLPFKLKGLISFSLAIIKILPNWMSKIIIKLLSLVTINKYKNIDNIIIKDALHAHPKTAELFFKEIFKSDIKKININTNNLYITVVRGEKDRIVSRETSINLATILNANYHEIKNAGHTPMLENTSKYKNALSNLLGQ